MKTPKCAIPPSPLEPARLEDVRQRQPWAVERCDNFGMARGARNETLISLRTMQRNLAAIALGFGQK